MGSFDVRLPESPAEARRFTRRALADLEALEALLASGSFETEPVRMGVEQEMYLVGQEPPHRPLPIATELLEALADPDVTSELALFNLEINLPPEVLEGGFLSHLEKSLTAAVRRVDTAAAEHGGRVLLTGILPGLRRRDLSPRNMTPEVRYRDLDRAIQNLRGGRLRIFIRGVDDFEQHFESIMVESANCSLQLHLQVDPSRFVELYNLAQLISAPLLAAATNSPILLGQRLWHETRVALFEASVDSRSDSEMTRGAPRRVTFGTDWLRSSALELFQDSLLRHRVLLVQGADDDGPRVPPKLRSLCLHNGTIWRWNRACYGVHDGRPHLRIENRVLPAGPTVVDEAANAALFYGLMTDLGSRPLDIERRLPFDTARGNFVKAARFGLDASLEWLDGEPRPARELLLTELIPAARRGLDALGCAASEIDRYLGIIEARVEQRRTGSDWLLAAVGNDGRQREAYLEAACSSLLAGVEDNVPVHLWPPPGELSPSPPAARNRSVRSIMTRDLLTLRPTDAAELATHLMRWRAVHHVPVENDAGEVVGLVSAGAGEADPAGADSVADLMDPSPVHVDPETSLTEAADIVQSTGATCLLVVAEGRLLGIATDKDIAEAMRRTS